MYSSTLIGAGGTVITGINNYLQNLSITNFDGSLKMSDLESFIRSLTGVTDVVLNYVYIRTTLDGALVLPTPPTPAYTALVGTPMVVNSQVVSRIYNSPPVVGSAGYIVSESTTGFQLQDSLTFISQ